MAYINQPADLRSMFNDLDNRIKKLENATRFTNPNVDFVTDTPSNPRVGDQYYDTDADLLKYWNGTSFIELADNNLGTSIIVTNNGILNTVNNNMIFTGQPLLVESQRIGKMVTAYAEITGTTVTNWGTGQIYFELPAGFPVFAHDVIASGSILDGGTLYTIFGKITQGDNKMYLFHPTSNGGSDTVTYNKPTVLDSTSQISINGVAIIA
jgi:hypothetical protein